MNLYLETDGERARFAGVTREASDWVSSGIGQGLFVTLGRAIGWFGFRTHPPRVIAVGMRRDGLSWSAVRKMVNVANTLGFAWGAPVKALPIEGGESREEIVRRVRKIDSQEGGDWIPPEYSGEPNITKAKKVI